MRELIKSSLSLSQLRTINIIFINPTKPMLINLQKKKLTSPHQKRIYFHIMPTKCQFLWNLNPFELTEQYRTFYKLIIIIVYKDI